MIAVRVICAFLTVGLRKSGTPFETASTPVIAVQPFAKARMMIHAPSVSVAAGIGGGATTGVGCPLDAIALPMPTIITMKSVATNA